jgi:hypothetical protein
MDEKKQERFDQLKKYFTNKKNKLNYIQEKGYYIELKHYEKSAGTRFYFHNKWMVEVVVDREDGPSQNICDFVLFSNMDDALMYAVLKEESYLNSKKKPVNA